MIVVIANPKGGVGKSTIAFNYAYQATLSKSGKSSNVAIVAMSDRTSFMTWIKRRTELKIQEPFLGLVGLNNPISVISKLAQVYDTVVVECDELMPENKLGSLVKIADLFIIPTAVGQGELDCTINYYLALQKYNKYHITGLVPRYVLFNRVPTAANSTELDDAKEYLRLAQCGIPILENYISSLMIWNKASREGSSIYEMPEAASSKKAINQFNMVCNELSRRHSSMLNWLGTR